MNAGPLWEATADLVVVGSGVAGLTAALPHGESVPASTFGSSGIFERSSTSAMR